MSTILIQTKEEFVLLVQDVIANTIVNEIKPILCDMVKEIISTQKKETSKKQILNMKDVQRLLGCSYPTLRKIMDNGELPFKKNIDCKSYHFLYEDVVKMIAAERFDIATLNPKIRKIA